MESDIVIGADGKQPKLGVPKDINNIQVSTRGPTRTFSRRYATCPARMYIPGTLVFICNGWQPSHETII